MKNNRLMITALVAIILNILYIFIAGYFMLYSIFIEEYFITIYIMMNVYCLLFLFYFMKKG